MWRIVNVHHRETCYVTGSLGTTDQFKMVDTSRQRRIDSQRDIAELHLCDGSVRRMARDER